MTVPPSVTDRQLEVLELLSRGLTFRQAGRQLELSEHTVRSHMRSALRRLRARNTAHAVRRAFELGLLTTDGAG